MARKYINIRQVYPWHEICSDFFWFLNRSWRISTTPNTTKFFLIIFKLIQQSIMVILSCLAKKNQNLNSRKKSSVYYWKLRFPARNTHKPPFSVIKWTFFPQIQISSFLREATQNDHIRLLYKFENDQKKIGCVGSCGYASASVNYFLMSKISIILQVPWQRLLLLNIQAFVE